MFVGECFRSEDSTWRCHFVADEAEVRKELAWATGRKASRATGMADESAEKPLAPDAFVQALTPFEYSNLKKYQVAPPLPPC